jgi:hypothetical protein
MLCVYYRLVMGTPAPRDCELYYVDRDALFSYHKLSEAFLQRVSLIHHCSTSCYVLRRSLPEYYYHCGASCRNSNTALHADLHCHAVELQAQQCVRVLCALAPLYDLHATDTHLHSHVMSIWCCTACTHNRS